MRRKPTAMTAWIAARVLAPIEDVTEVIAAGAWQIQQNDRSGLKNHAPST
jgi:hypothetical protein